MGHVDEDQFVAACKKATNGDATKRLALLQLNAWWPEGWLPERDWSSRSLSHPEALVLEIVCTALTRMCRQSCDVHVCVICMGTLWPVCMYAPYVCVSAGGRPYTSPIIQNFSAVVVSFVLGPVGVAAPKATRMRILFEPAGLRPQSLQGAKRCLGLLRHHGSLSGLGFRA